MRVSATRDVNGGVRLVCEDGHTVILTKLEVTAILGVCSPGADANDAAESHLRMHRSLASEAHPG